MSGRGPGPQDGPRPRSSVVRLGLLGGFSLTVAGAASPVASNVQRLLAFLALQDRAVSRNHAASTLWPEVTEAHAAGSLRSAIWKVRRIGVDLVVASRVSLELAPSVTVDVRDARTLARLAANVPSWWVPVEEDVALLTDDLLPGWYEEWVLLERERYRQLRLHALEALCGRFVEIGRFGAAVQAGLAAVGADPLRETAQLALVKAFLAEGNRVEAVRHYERFRRVLRDELGVDPSPDLQTLFERPPGASPR